MITRRYSECGPKKTIAVLNDDDNKIKNKNIIKIIIVEYKDLNNRNSAYVECKRK
jgi:hypothetical protein